MKRIPLYVVACSILLTLPLALRANSTAQTLPFAQDWSNIGLITANDDWSSVPGVVGHLGEIAATSTTGVDPQTIVDDLTGVVDVIANQTNPNLANGGVAEFQITNPVIALQGSGTADAPFILINLDTQGFASVHVDYNLRDIDGSADNAIQPVALQYRVGNSGNFTNVPAGFVPDATTGPSLATLVTPVSVTLPAAVAGHPLVQLRIITTNAVGNDEWVGIDDIVIIGDTGMTSPAGVGEADPSTVAAGNTTLLTVTVTPGTNPTSTGLEVAADLSSIGGSPNQSFVDNGNNVFTFQATVSPGTSPGAKSPPFTITDAQGRLGSGSISLQVVDAPTDPAGTGTADPDPVASGGFTQLTVTVTPGANPTSTGLQVTVDLTSIGGAANQSFADSGNFVFTFAATVSPGTLSGAKSLPFTILDAQGRVGSGTISLSVVDAPTDPTGTGTASPATVESGAVAALAVAVVPGENPTSTGVQVTADLTSIGGAAAQPFTDTGANSFSFNATVSPGTLAGAKSLPFTITDAQGRSGTGTISLTVVDPPPVVLIPPIPFFENWTNISRITVDHTWTGVSGIVGYRGDDLTTVTGTNPQVIVADGSSTPINVEANETNPNGFATGGVAEFHLANPTIALNGSGTADAPHIVLSVNTTGHFGIGVSYNLRDLDGSTDNATQAVALQYRIGNAGNYVNIPAGVVADATDGGLATRVTPVFAMLPANANNQPLVQIRIITTNAVGNDEWVGIDDIAVTDAMTGPTGVGTATPDAVEAGDTSLLTVAVTLGQNPLSTGVSVTMDLAPIGGGALQPFFDNGTGGDVTAGDNVFSFNATVGNGIATGLKTLSGTVADAQGRFTATSIVLNVITPPVITPIHDIQGAGQSSPFAGQTMTTTGIVTARKFNGFFIQTPDELVDNNSNSSEGVFVFTSSTPPATAAVGNRVRVTGMVQEFVPGADPFQLPLTEITAPAVVVLSGGNILPAPVTLTASDTSPAGPLDQLERFEGMRVQVNSLLITDGTGGNVNEQNATGSSDGVFYAVIPPNPRPFREPGIHVFDPLPPGSPATVTRFDGNPELIRIDSDALIGAPRVDVTAGEVAGTIVGPLDYGFRAYTILPEPESPIIVDETVAPTPVSMPTANQFTVAAYNIERFFDTVDQPGIGEPVLTSTAFNNRLNKTSLAVRNILRTPDIIAVEEVENLTTLQAVASKINADVMAAGQPNPNYVAYLEEGNDPGGIDVGFLVKSTRVIVLDVEQVGKDATYINPVSNQPDLLNDRPPLVLRAIVASANGATSPITVIANHLRSLLGLEDADGRVRAKRNAQAVFLADWIQDRQDADPDEQIISVGDYNAFQFSDGYVDTIGTIQGTPTPASEVVLAGGDLVNPDLFNLIETVPADQRYSYVFDGNAQAIDHALVTQNLLSQTNKLEFGRVGADFSEIARTDPEMPTRLSDHDPLVVFFNFDNDDDGVADGDDACPATPPGAIVNSAGCSIAQLCSPTASWKNHGQYVSCVSNTADAFFNAGLITAEQAEAITSAAAKSKVGKQ